MKNLFVVCRDAYGTNIPVIITDTYESTVSLSRAINAEQDDDRAAECVFEAPRLAEPIESTGIYRRQMESA